MESLLDFQYNQIRLKFQSELREFNCFAYYHKFGECFSWKHPTTKQILYTPFVESQGFQLMNEQQMIQYLKDNWRPHDQQGIDYYCDRIANNKL